MIPEIPQRRKPIEDKAPQTVKDPLKKFLSADSRWEELPGYFRFLVALNANEIHRLTPEELILRAKDLDQEALQHPYLKTITTKEGNLIDLHSSVTDTFNQQLDGYETDSHRASDRIMRVFVAGRQLGKKIADQLGWDPKDGFGEHARHAQISIDLCTKAVREIPPNHI